MKEEVVAPEVLASVLGAQHGDSALPILCLPGLMQLPMSSDM
jgi:hypothetical protein